MRTNAIGDFFAQQNGDQPDHIARMNNHRRYERTGYGLSGSRQITDVVEDIRKALDGPSNASEKVALLKELLTGPGYRVDGH
ncbi:hypothetical protein MA20_10860 [Bradyrhizobium japonicum]|uniref:Uncharacterized protein n=1 Tax=Bradyrhizobium japonicum TaxID=375 RepID=A0A0A3Z1F9_BRAJP|nr:hypothetical protein MA20_10860 [Bradyrhizobium japonicum]